MSHYERWASALVTSVAVVVFLAPFVLALSHLFTGMKGVLP